LQFKFQYTLYNYTENTLFKFQASSKNLGMLIVGLGGPSG